MSKRKTRKEKIKSKERRIKQVQELRELNELKNQAASLEEQLKTKKRENVKNMHIRNLKIIGGVCNFLLPYVVCAGVGIGTGKFLGLGTPFVIDELKTHKAYSLEYQLDGQINYRERYVFNVVEDSEKLILYYPFEQTGDDEYSRKVHKYNLSGKQNPLLYEALLQGNMEYIIENLKDYVETIEKINYIPNNIDSYAIEASLSYKNKDDVLIYHESEENNQGYIEFIFYASMAGGTVFVFCRKFKLPRYIKDTYLYYSMNDLKPLKQELEQTNNKIKVLLEKV